MKDMPRTPLVINRQERGTGQYSSDSSEEYTYDNIENYSTEAGGHHFYIQVVTRWEDDETHVVGLQIEDQDGEQVACGIDDDFMCSPQPCGEYLVRVLWDMAEHSTTRHPVLKKEEQDKYHFVSANTVQEWYGYCWRVLQVETKGTPSWYGEAIPYSQGNLRKIFGKVSTKLVDALGFPFEAAMDWFRDQGLEPVTTEPDFHFWYFGEKEQWPLAVQQAASVRVREDLCLDCVKEAFRHLWAVSKEEEKK